MTWGLAGAFAAAVAYGAATVLQAVGARALTRADRPDAALLKQLVHSLPYVVGLLLDAVGFVLSLAALRTEPLFTVQAIVASSLAVTALLATVVLRARPGAAEWAAVALVTAGLTLLALSAHPQDPSRVSYAGRFALLIGVLCVAALTAGAAVRTTGRPGREAWALGSLAGLMYGAGGIGARVVAKPRNLGSLLVDPAVWAIVVAGVLGLLLYAMALQRGSVTAATASVVVAETVVPAALGVTLLGDHPAPGRAGLAAAGFVLSVLGSVALARYGEPPVTSGEPERNRAQLVSDRG